MLGMIFVFFQKQTRFQILTKNLDKIKKISSILILIIFSIKSYSIESTSNLLKDNIIDINHSDKLESLLVQHDGRIYDRERRQRKAQEETLTLSLVD